MATINIPGYDDPAEIDGCLQFDKVNSFGRSSALAADELKYALNMDTDPADGVRTRRGGEALGADPIGTGLVQGGVYFDTPAKKCLFALSGGLPYTWDGTAWTLQSGFNVGDATRRVCSVMGVDSIFIADGVNHLHAWDGEIFQDLGVYAGPVSTDFKPPIAKFVRWFDFALFAAGSDAEPDALWRSDLLDGATWNHATNKLRIGAGEGDPITGICGWTNLNFVVGKRNHIYMVLADPTVSMSQWAVKSIADNVGCVSHQSMAQVGQDLFWLARDGVRSLMYTNQANTQSVAEPLSRPIQDVIDQINWAVADTACGVYWRNRYLLSVPIGTSTEPNYVLVYNTMTQGWSGFWTGWNVTAWLTSFLNNNARLAYGAADGTVSQWMDYVPTADETSAHYLDRGAGYPSQGTTRGMIANEQMAPKQGYHAELEFYRSQADVTVQVILDGGTPKLFYSGPTVQSGFSVYGDPLPWILQQVGVFRKADDLQRFGSWRELQVDFRAESGKLAVRTILMTAFLEAILPTI